MKKLISLSLSISFLFSVSAQTFPTKKQAEEFVSTKLYVVVFPTLKESLEYMDEKDIVLDDDKLEEMKEKYVKIDSFMTAYKEIFENNWTKNKDFVFINNLELAELMAKFNPTKKGGTPISILNMAVNIDGVMKTSDLTNSLTATRYSTKSYSFTSVFHNGNLDLGELLLGLLQLQGSIQLSLDNASKSERREYAFRKNGDQFKNRTLIVLDEDLSEGLTIEEIKEVYPFKVEVVDRKQMNQILLQKDNTKLVVMVLWANTTAYQAIFLPENGELANIIFNIIGGPATGLLGEIKKPHFERYIKRAD